MNMSFDEKDDEGDFYGASVVQEIPKQRVNKKETDREIEALIKATERNRRELLKTWKKVEELDAAIQSAKSDQLKRKQNGKPD